MTIALTLEVAGEHNGPLASSSARSLDSVPRRGSFRELTFFKRGSLKAFGMFNSKPFQGNNRRAPELLMSEPRAVLP
jgi:hypothetical protein